MSTSGANQTQQPQSLFHDEVKEIVQQETVQFIEDGDVQTEDNLISINPDYLRVGEDSLTNAVVNFLQRPVVVSEFTWTSGDAALTEKFRLSFPGTLLSRAMQQQKIAGFRYFRADLVLRLQVNAQPFNAGRMILWWEPFGNSQSITPSNVRHFGGITGYKHVDLDVANSTAVELKIPYMSPLAYTDLITGFGEMGLAHGCIYSSLTGGDDVEGTLWAHFENVRLEMPTGMPLHTFTTTPTRLQAQSNTVLKDKPKEKKKGKGDWQSLFDAQSQAAKSLNGIPVIGEVATAITWFADAASWVSGLFGWSRPTNPDFETPVSIRYLRNFCNFNGNTLSKPLSLDARNEIVLPKGYVGTDEDEMCFAHILSQPVYMTRFDYTTSETPGTLLWSWPVSPASCLTTVAGTQVTRQNTFLSFVSDAFSLWRGGINYHFKVIKTPFHSGRLRFIFVPGAVHSTPVASLDLDKCFTQIVDLRDNNEFDFTIPYVSNTLWTEIANRPNYADGELQRGKPTGVLYVEVLNTLKAAGQADPKVEVIVETSAHSDFQFAELELDDRVVIAEDFPPASITLKAQMNSDFQFLFEETTERLKDNGRVKIAVNEAVHKYQGPGDPKFIMNFYKQDSKRIRQFRSKLNEFPPTHLKAQIMFFPSIDMEGVKPNLVTTGEVVTGFRQCLKRYTQMSPKTTPDIPATEGSFNRLYPYSTSSNDGNVTDLFSYVSHIFRVMSGSMRVLLVPTDDTTAHTYDFDLAYPVYAGDDIDVPFCTPALGARDTVPTSSRARAKFFSSEQLIEFDVPWYQEVPIMPTPLGRIPGRDFDSADPSKIPQNRDSAIDFYKGNFTVNRSIGEDFNFSYLVGPPISVFTNIV